MIQVAEYEVVWPLYRGHYLSIPDERVMNTDLASPDVTPTSSQQSATGRELAARALLANGDCTQQRASELLAISRRSIGRTTAAAVVAALHDEAVVGMARASLTESATRGSTVEERTAAEAWLERARRDDQQVERGHHQVATAMRPQSKSGPVRRVSRNGSSGSEKRSAAKPATRMATKIHEPPAPCPTLAGDQVDALRRHQQRILHRSTVINVVLKAEPRAMGDELAELLMDISEAARLIGAILEQVGSGRGVAS